VRIEGREVKRLRGKEISLVKIVWEGATGRGGATPQLAWALAQAQLQLSL